MKFGIVLFVALTGITVNAQQMIDIENPSTITSISEIKNTQVGGQIACSMSINFAKSVPQPLTRSGEACEKLTIAFVSASDLRSLNKLNRLTPEAKTDIANTYGSKALYVEGEFTSSVYIKNVAGFLYEVTLAD